MKKQWKLFYKSPYGKIGFYILLAFIIITLISPLIIIDHNPVTYFAPPEDVYTVDHQLTANVSFTPTSTAMSTVSSTSGASLIYNTGKSTTGAYLVYGTSIINGSSYKLFNIPSKPLGMDVFTAGSYSTFLRSGESIPGYHTYVMVYTAHHLYILYIHFKGPTYGTGSIYVTSQSLHISSNVDTVFSSALPYHNTPVGIPEFNSTSIYPVFIYTITSNASKYNITAYYLADIYKPIKSVQLSHSTNPQMHSFFGTYYTDSTHQRVLIWQGDNLTIFTPTLNSNVTKPLRSYTKDISIPSDYQSQYNPSNLGVFMLSNSSVIVLNPVTTNIKYVYNGTKLNYIASTPGSSGFPAYVAVTSGYNIFFLSGYHSVHKTINATYYINGIEESGDTFLTYNSASGKVTYYQYITSSQPIGWALYMHKAISTPVFTLNPKTARISVAFNSLNSIVIYGINGKDLNPIPPTLHTLSGTSFPLGTTSTGQSAWALFIGSFPPDLEVGFVVGIIILIISVIAAMAIGYFSGLPSTLAETFTLAIYLIPGLPLLIVLAKILGPSLPNIILILSLVGWTFPAFTLIGIVRSVKSRTFIDSAKVSGVKTPQILRRHMLPNMAPLLIYLTAINIGGAVAAISTLEILGLAPVTIPTWGGMLSGFYGDFYALAIAPWWFIPPIIAITLFILAFIFIARGMDEVVNPRLGGRR